MIENTPTLEQLINRAEDYSKSTIELIKLTAIDKSADVFSSFVSRVLIALAIAISILIINIGIALWLGEILGNAYYGFFITGGFYACVAIFLYAFRRQWIKEPVDNAMIQKMLKQKTS